VSTSSSEPNEGEISPGAYRAGTDAWDIELTTTEAPSGKEPIGRQDAPTGVTDKHKFCLRVALWRPEDIKAVAALRAFQPIFLPDFLNIGLSFLPASSTLTQAGFPVVSLYFSQFSAFC